MLTPTKKKYLFVIYELGQKGAQVRSVDVAKALNVKKASISNMLPSLVEENLIRRQADGSITFTPNGAQYAGGLYLKYITLYQFFSADLGSSPDSARSDAITCLCSLSEENIENMAEYILNQ